VISRLYSVLVDYSCAQIFVHVRSLIFEFSSTFMTYSRHYPNMMHPFYVSHTKFKRNNYLFQSFQ